MNPDKRCPDCGAGIYHQCSTNRDGSTLDTPEYAAAAYRESARRLREQANQCDRIAEEYMPANVM